MNKTLNDFGISVNVDNVQEYCRHSKELTSSQSSKALKFVKFKCLKYLGDFNNPEFDKIREKYGNAKQLFMCLPLNKKDHHMVFGIKINKIPFLSNYNNSEYIIYKDIKGTFQCNCQGFQSKKRKGKIIEGGANCSHILALFYSFKLKTFCK